jgi:hypothetical protein
MKKIIAAVAVVSAFVAPVSFAAESLAGMYGGLNLGLGTLTSTVEDSDCWYECSSYTNRPTDFTYGLKFGQNLTSGSFLYGWDVDYDFSSISKDGTAIDYGTAGSGIVHESKLKSLATAKVKVGLVVQDTAIAMSYGLALGDLDDAYVCASCGPNEARTSGQQMGVAYGMSLQHALGNNLVLSGEYQTVKFNTANEPMNDGSDYYMHFIDSLDQFRVSVAYKFF